MRTRSHPSSVLVSALLCTALCSAQSAHADGDADKSQARQLGDEASTALNKGDWSRAESLFRRAESLYHAPTLLLGQARADVHLGKFVDAWEAYHRIVLEGAPPGANAVLRQAVEDAKKEMVGVEKRRGRVTISVVGPQSPTVTLDGAPVPVAALDAERPVDPGAHTVHVTATGYKDAESHFTVAEGEAATARVTPEVEPNAPPNPSTAAPLTTAPSGGATPADIPPTATSSTRKTLGIAAIGIGGAGIVVGAVTGILAMGKHSDLSGNACATTGCGQPALGDYNSSVSSYQTLGTVSTISFIAGGVLAATGVVLLVTAPSHPSAHSSTTGGVWWTPYVAAGSAGAVGTF